MQYPHASYETMKFIEVSLVDKYYLQALCIVLQFDLRWPQVTLDLHQNQ